MTPTFDMTVFHDCGGEAVARAYVLAAPTIAVDRAELAAWRISGHVVGPTCRYSTTLQAKIPLVHRGLTQWGDRTALMAEAVVPDPCYWSTELPFLYRAVGDVMTSRSGKVPFDQAFGMRSLAVVRKRIVLNGKAWVPRIVRREIVGGDVPLSSWRETQTVMLVVDPDEALCAEASEAGVMIAAVAEVATRSPVDAASRLSRYPAVVIVLIAGPVPLDETVRSAARNTLLGKCSSLGEGDVAVYRWNESDDFVHCAGERPVIIMRFLDESRSLVDARRACDTLQADLAGKCNAAGYIV